MKTQIRWKRRTVSSAWCDSNNELRIPRGSIIKPVYLNVPKQPWRHKYVSQNTHSPLYCVVYVCSQADFMIICTLFSVLTYYHSWESCVFEMAVWKIWHNILINDQWCHQQAEHIPIFWHLLYSQEQKFSSLPKEVSLIIACMVSVGCVPSICIALWFYWEILCGRGCV